MSRNTTCLITGANRGIGRGLATALLTRPHHTVIAAVRDPSHPTALSLVHDSLPARSSRLILLQMDAASSPSIAAAFASLAADHGVTALDLVVANAGIGWAVPGGLAGVAVPSPSPSPSAAGEAGEAGEMGKSGRDALRPFVEVNAYGPFELFGAAAGLMGEAAKERSSGANGEGEGIDGWKKPRFVLVSSNLGSFGLMGGATGYGLYGASKAMANFLVRWLALENGEEMVVCAVHPGPVKTDMGELAIEHLEQMGVDLKLEWLSVEESVRGLLAVIDDAERKNLNGRFIQHDGTELPW